MRLLDVRAPRTSETLAALVAAHAREPLYVTLDEADETAARQLYESMGFRPIRRQSVCRIPTAQS